MWVRFPPGTALIARVDLFGDRARKGFDLAFRILAEPNVRPPAPLDPQLVLDLEAAIARTQKNCSPSLFGYPFLWRCQKGVLTDRMQLAADLEFVPSSLRPIVS